MQTGISQPEALGITSELGIELQTLYGSRLRGVYLFGSCARGESEDGSELDVLIVLDRLDNYGPEVDFTGEVNARLSLKHEVSISRVFVAESEWKNGNSWFLQNVRREAVSR